jgi:hypothetical protein
MLKKEAGVLAGREDLRYGRPEACATLMRSRRKRRSRSRRSHGVVDDLLMGDVELMGDDGGRGLGVAEVVELFEGAHALVLGAEGHAHHGFAVGSGDVVHGEFGETSEDDIERGGLAGGNGLGMSGIAGDHGGGEGLEAEDHLDGIGIGLLERMRGADGAEGGGGGVEEQRGFGGEEGGKVRVEG